MALFNGYNTVAGEDGSTLSGSKKQRASAVRNADQIVGGGPETDRFNKGTHDALMAQDGLYRRFVQVREQAEGWRLE